MNRKQVVMSYRFSRLHTLASQIHGYVSEEGSEDDRIHKVPCFHHPVSSELEESAPKDHCAVAGVEELADPCYKPQS